MIVTSPKHKTGNTGAKNKRIRKDSPVNFGVTGQPNGSSTSSSKPKNRGLLRIPPWKIIVTTIAIGVAGYFYLTHLFATQAVYDEVQRLEQEHEAAQRIYQDRQLTYDRMTGPVQIYQRAGELGFIHGDAADPTIEAD